MDDGQHVNLILFDTIDDPVGGFDQLADIVGLILGNFSPWKIVRNGVTP